MLIWDKWGPFQWDIMASSANVNRDPLGNRLNFFSRYFDPLSKGVNVFAQDLTKLQGIFCFPPIPMIGKLLKFMEQQQIDCVIVLPAINSPWVNLVSSYFTDLEVVSEPYNHKVFSILNGEGKRVPKKYPHSMIAVKLSFASTSNLLKHIFHD
jgi:hypothetical protein